MTKSEQIDQDAHGQKTKQSLVWFTTLPLLMHILRFANSILLARLLSPEDFGLIGIVTVILFYSDIFSDFGFSKAIVQRKHASAEHYYSFFTFNIFVSIFLFTIFQLSSESIAAFFEVPDMVSAIQVFTFTLLLSSFSTIPKIKLRRELKFKALAIIEAVKIATSMVISLTMAHHGYGFWSLIVAMLASQVVTLIPLMVAATIFPRPYWGLHFLKELFAFSKWDFLSGQITLLSENLDKIIIGKSLGTAQLGFYEKAMGFAKMPYDQISTKMANVAFSSFSRAQDEKGLLHYYFNKIVVLNSVLLMPFLFGLAATSENFVRSFLGEKWMPIVTSLELFSLSFVLASLRSVIVSMNLAEHRVKPQTFINLYCTVCLVVMLSFSVSYGIEWVVVSLLVFNLILLIGSFQLLASYSGIRWKDFFRNITPATTVSIVMYAMIVISNDVISLDSSWLSLLVAVVVGGGVYVLGMLCTPFEVTHFIRKKAFALIKKIGIVRIGGR